MKFKNIRRMTSLILVLALMVCAIQWPAISYAATTVKTTANGYNMTNEFFNIDIGAYGQIESLRIVGDEFDNNYVMNAENAAAQGQSVEHQWMGELMFQTKVGDATAWTQSMTSASPKGSTARKVALDGNKVTVTYENEAATKGIKDFKLVETYELVDKQLRWSMKVTNTNIGKNITFGDFGLPMPFNEFWAGADVYERRTVDHSFVGQDSSYIYATRPSGQGRFLLFTPEVATGAKLEYQDHWRVDNGHPGSVWAMDQGGWANGLNVFYIHSNVIKSTGSSYLKNTELTLAPGESKEYSFNFSGVANEKAMRTELYNEDIIDAVAVPSMIFAVDMPAKFYLHTKLTQDQISSVEVQCAHDTHVYEGRVNSVSNKQTCTKAAGTSVTFSKTEIVDGEQYHIYDLKLSCLGANNVVINYGVDKEATLQFYATDNSENALNLHADFVATKTQVDAPGTIQDKLFDDWMMDTKSVRGVYKGYMGWGDDWGFTHGEYLAEKNVYQPVASQITAVDEYLDIGIWNGLMREHHEDYLVNDWLDEEPNGTGQGTNRGYAYLHVYNTYFSMYKVAEKYPDMIEYKETKETYLLRAFNIMKSLYDNNISYSDAGLMGESTTPAIIDALKKEGFYEEAKYVTDTMTQKYNGFKDQKYPYASEYPFDNTGEESVYTLANLQGNTEMMRLVDLKTRACRGVQPIWYHYGNPTTICGENWWNFQYSVSLVGYCMDNWLRLQPNGMSDTDRALAARVNYAAKLATLSSINSGQIDSAPENIGTVGWTYQSELGITGGLGNGGGALHNGWRQMSGEQDTGLFGALRILSSDIVIDPIFGLFGYGCNVSEADGKYTVIPLDGVFSRLNFINQKLSIELDRDQYTKAIVNKDNTAVVLDMKNLEGTMHESNIQLTGLKAGSYTVDIDGAITGSFLAKDGQTAIVTLPLPKATTAKVTIQSGAPTANTAPVVKAGDDQSTHLSDAFRLVGEVKDDGYPNMTMTNAWTLESKPVGSNVVMKNADKLITEVSFDKVGAYVFKLAVSDGALSGNDTITVDVTEDLPVPVQLANYTFEKIDADKKLVLDETAQGYNSSLISKPTIAAAKDENGIVMNGSYCGYVKLPVELTKRVNEATIALDVKLNAAQGNGARLFEFGDMDKHYFNVYYENGNEIVLSATNLTTGISKKVNTGVVVAPSYWKNIAVTLKDNTAILYVDGKEKAKLEEIDFSLARLGEVQRNFIGRSENKGMPFLNGIVDNFDMKSVAMSSADILSSYGLIEEPTIVSATGGTVVTSVSVAPTLPTEISVLYTDGIYQKAAVIWDAVLPESYAKAGEFLVNGLVNGTISSSIKVIVASGTIQNVAANAVPTAIINTPDDLGGVVGLNDGFDPTSSRDTSHGVWHNWRGNQSGPAWVQYDWGSEVILTGIDAYYFTDGNFAPASAEIQYRDANNAWVPVTNAKGLGIDLNKYNYTSFDPVVTTGLRMVMKPKTLANGVIEWKAYGYSSAVVLDKQALETAISTANGLMPALFVSGWEAVQTALAEANEVKTDTSATQLGIDIAASKLNKAIMSLASADGNIAYNADVTTSYVSPWEKLSAVNDGAVSAKSDAAGVSHYGTWGNTSTNETVTYTWSGAMNITSAAIFIWNDGGGIKTPTSCKYEYKDNSNNWVEVVNPVGYGVELDKFNVTTFSAITTQGLRVTLEKVANDGEGIGLIEWTVSGEYIPVQVNIADLQTTIQLADAKVEADYTADSWSIFASNLLQAKAIVSNANTIQLEVDAFKASLEAAMVGLVKEYFGNLALIATVSASIDRPEDLGGAAALNDNFEPANSNDKSHAVWHSWTNEGLDAWVKYTWDKPVSISSSKAYYFSDGGGIVMPAKAVYEYLGADQLWHEIAVVTDIKAEQYNVVNFDVPFTTTALRMTMSPNSDGTHAVGILEWKVIEQVAAQVVEAPTASLTAGTYTEAQIVTLATTTPGASIYYTLDGSEPTTDSTLYSAPINVAASTVVKAIAVKTGMNNSLVSDFNYTINIPQIEQVAKPTASLAEGAYTEAQTVTLTTATAGASIYYTTDGITEPTTASTLYSAPINVAASTVVKAIAVKTGMNNSLVSDFNYTINIPQIEQVAKPTASLAEGAYTEAQTVTLTTATAGASIYYTTDGVTEPTTASTKYSAPINVAASTVVKAIAVKAGMTDSTVSTYSYTINIPDPVKEQVAKPTSSLADGTYTSAQTVTLATATAGASIYYTTDGITEPTTASTKYSAPINVTSSTVIKAIAVKTGMKNSAVSTFSYTINISSGSTGGGSTSTPATQTPVITASSDGKVIITNTQKVLSGAVVNEVSAVELDKALAKAIADTEGLKTVIIETKKVDNINKYVQKLPAETVSQIKQDKNIQIKTPVANLTVPSNMIKTSDAKDSKLVEIVIEAVKNADLNKEVQKQIGDRPVINLYASVDGKRIEWNNSSAPVTVEISYTPTAKELENPDGIVVYYIDGNNNLIAIPSGRYDKETGKVTFKTTHFSNYAISYSEKSFTDLTQPWAEKAINALYAKGIVEGRSENEFSPKLTITREESLAWLVRSLGITADANSNFDDVSDSKYSKEIAIAKALGITSGIGNNKFDPKKAITRQDLMTLIVNALDIAKKSLEKGTQDEISGYADASNVSKYAIESVATLVKSGIIVGSGKNINPKGNTTRAEAAVIMYKLYNK